MFTQPVPIIARLVWDHGGEEWVDTVALGWTGRDVYVRMTDRRYQPRARLARPGGLDRPTAWARRDR